MGSSVSREGVSAERSGPDDYWKVASFAKKYARNNVLGVDGNQGAKEFQAICFAALCQGIQYLVQRPLSILDLGCGHAVRSISFKAQFGCKVTGADYSPAMLDMAKLFNDQIPEPHRIDLVQADATDLPFADDEFDVVTCYGLMMSLPTLEVAADEIMRVAKYGLVAIEELEAAMTPDQHASLDNVRTKIFPGRIYWHDYLRSFGHYPSFTYNPLVLPESWDLGVPPAYGRLIVVKRSS